jgi:hypothetical protein
VSVNVWSRSESYLAAERLFTQPIPLEEDWSIPKLARATRFFLARFAEEALPRPQRSAVELAKAWCEQRFRAIHPRDSRKLFSANPRNRFLPCSPGLRVYTLAHLVYIFPHVPAHRRMYICAWTLYLYIHILLLVHAPFFFSCACNLAAKRFACVFVWAVFSFSAGQILFDAFLHPGLPAHPLFRLFSEDKHAACRTWQAEYKQVHTQTHTSSLVQTHTHQYVLARALVHTNIRAHAPAISWIHCPEDDEDTGLAPNAFAAFDASILLSYGGSGRTGVHGVGSVPGDNDEYGGDEHLGSRLRELLRTRAGELAEIASSIVDVAVREVYVANFVEQVVYRAFGVVHVKPFICACM